MLQFAATHYEMTTKSKYQLLSKRETESEKRIQNTQNKPCRVELVTKGNRDYRP